jgi:hypothetical protein
MSELYPIIKISTSNKILYDYFVNNSIKIYTDQNITFEYTGLSRIDKKLIFKIKNVSYSNIPLIDIFNNMNFNGQQFNLNKDDLDIISAIEEHTLAYNRPKYNIDIHVEYDKFVRNFKLDNLLNNIIYSDIEILKVVEDYINTQHPFMTIIDFKDRRNYLLEKLIEKKI